MLTNLLNKLIKKLRRSYLGNVIILKPNNFISWWNSYKKKNLLNKDLVLIVDDYIKTDSFNKIKSMWNFLAQQHIKIINEKGIENFRQTIEPDSLLGDAALNSRRIKSIRNKKIKINYDINDVYKKYEHLNLNTSISYKITNIMLLNYIIESKKEKYLSLLSDNKKNFGNPLIINYKNLKFTSATLNSILDISSIEKKIKLSSIKEILEIGAGWGRLCHSILRINSKIKYTIIDIPPALYYAQYALKKYFPKLKIFSYRKFNNFYEIKDEFEDCNIRFLLPNQINVIPDKYFNLAIAVDCLHEISKPIVEEYFDQIDRLSRNFYFKCQTEQWATFDKNKFDMFNYPVKKNWIKIFHKKCFVPDDYFHGFYKIK